MAAFSTDRLLGPRAGSPAAAAVFRIPRVRRRRPTYLSETVRTIWRAALEYLALLWMLAVVAFCLLLAAGAAGFLG
jgi:hypothetical protein